MQSCYKAPIHTLDATGTEMARPTKYSPALQKKADDYVKDHMAHGDPVPSIEGLADHLDIHRDTCYAWRDSIEAFSDTFQDVRSCVCVCKDRANLMQLVDLSDETPRRAPT